MRDVISLDEDLNLFLEDTRVGPLSALWMYSTKAHDDLLVARLPVLVLARYIERREFPVEAICRSHPGVCVKFFR